MSWMQSGLDVEGIGKKITILQYMYMYSSKPLNPLISMLLNWILKEKKKGVLYIPRGYFATLEHRCWYETLVKPYLRRKMNGNFTFLSPIRWYINKRVILCACICICLCKRIIYGEDWNKHSNIYWMLPILILIEELCFFLCWTSRMHLTVFTMCQNVVITLIHVHSYVYLIF